jgi:hypothetical protein
MADDWRADVRLGLENLVDKAVVTGARHLDVFAVVEEELARLRVALDKDPDPAEDGTQVIDEPANDWPAASGDQAK